MENKVIEAIASELVQAYEQIRYSPECSVAEFLITRGRYDVLQKLIDDAQKDDNWKHPAATLPPIGGLRLKMLEIEARANASLLETLFLESISNTRLRSQTESIVSDSRLAEEAANEFLDVYRGTKDHTLEEFLKRYDRATGMLIDGRKFRDGEGKHVGHYHAMYERLNSRGNWQSQFYSLLPSELAARIKSVAAGQAGDENKIGLLELLSEQGLTGVLEVFGLDAFDIVDTIQPGLLKPEDRDTMTELSPNGIRYWLGKCRRRRLATDTAYDWEHGLLARVTRNVDAQVLDRNIAAQAILKNLVIGRYGALFTANREQTLATIAEDIGESTNAVEQMLLAYALGHYTTMVKCASLENVKRSLMITETKGVKT
jgi:hypothetical protein